MQLLVRYDFDDRTEWKSRYDDQEEPRGQAGLRQLQLWTEGDTNVWALYDISDRGKADDYLDSYAKLGGSPSERHFLTRM